MNKLKSIFLAVYIPLMGIITIIALFKISLAGFQVGWAGVFLTAAPPVGAMMWSRSTYSKGRSRPAMPVLMILIGLGAVLGIYDYFLGHGDVGAIILAGVGLLGFLVFNFWYSRYGRAINPLIEVGKILPHFNAVDLDGNAARSDALQGSPALFMFYRGNWCPFCTAQVRQITDYYRQLTDRGVRVVLISPQPPQLTKRVAEHYDVPFDFWIDKNYSAAKTLDILHQEGVPYGHRKDFGADTVLPTVIIVDPDGRIIYTDQTNNYRSRPEPEVFLRALHERA